MFFRQKRTIRAGSSLELPRLQCGSTLFSIDKFFFVSLCYSLGNVWLSDNIDTGIGGHKIVFTCVRLGNAYNFTILPIGKDLAVEEPTPFFRLHLSDLEPATALEACRVLGPIASMPTKNSESRSRGSM